MYDFHKCSSCSIFIDAKEDIIMAWNWECELQKGEKARTREKFDNDIKRDLEDYRSIILPTKRNADFIIEKSENHNFEVILASSKSK